jgi:hypothetical protein
MMDLSDKIKKMYPELKNEDFIGPFSTISLRDDSDGNGTYIAKWDHPTMSKPTDEQLKNV